MSNVCNFMKYWLVGGVGFFLTQEKYVKQSCQDGSNLVRMGQHTSMWFGRNKKLEYFF